MTTAPTPTTGQPWYRRALLAVRCSLKLRLIVVFMLLGVLSAAGLLLLFSLQYLFYAGRWPEAGNPRYMFPGILARYLAILVFAAALYETIRVTSGRQWMKRAFGVPVHHAVDAEADHEAVLERFDVDVGRVLLDRLREQRIDQANDWRFVL